MKKTLSKTLALFMVVAMLTGLVACGGGGTTSSTPGASTPAPGSSTPAPTPGSSTPAPKDKEVRYAESIEMLSESGVAVIDPYAPGASGGSYRAIYSCIYDRLVAFLPDGSIVPELAISWKTDDSQTYTFTLRDDVYFSNGDKFTAQSVVDSCETGKASAGSMGFDTWRSVDKATAIDEKTVEITLSTVNVDFLFYLTLPGGSIIHKGAREADPVKGIWVGTGAYTVTDFVSSDYTVLTSNDNYWGEKPITKELIIRFIPEVAARTIRLKNGQSQLSFNTSPQDLDMFVADKDFTVIDFVSNATNSVGFNMNGPITGDLNFRKAVAHALNRAEIAVVASGKWALPAESDGAFWGMATEFRNTDIPLIPYDLELAKKYLADSPYKGEEIELISGNPDTNKGAEMIKEQLGKIGINIKLFQTDNATLAAYAKYEGNQVQMIHYVNSLNNSASSARAILYPFGAGNRASYNNPAVNDLLDLAPTIADPKERGEVYKKVQAAVAEDLPYINVYYAVRTIVADAGIGGIVLNPDLNHSFRGVYLELAD